MHRKRPLTTGLIVYSVVLAVAGAMLWQGLRVRYWAWYATEDIRFTLSVNNALQWGHYANELGYIEVYDKLVEQSGKDGDYNGAGRFSLDYAPLRLRIAAWWAAWTDKNMPTPGRTASFWAGRPVIRPGAWQPSYEFNRPMMWLNNACELAGAIGVFLLVRYWVRRCDVPPASILRRDPRAAAFLRPPQDAAVPWLLRTWRTVRGRLDSLRGPDPIRDAMRQLSPYRGLFAGLAAAMLLWFSPAVIFNGHCYPQWDVWLLPAFFLGVYFGLRNWWMLAGALVGAVAMAKGQILLISPLFLLWPLFAGRPSGLVKFLVGSLLAVGVITCPWLVRNDEAWWWVARVIIACAILSPVFFLRRHRWWAILAQGVCVVAATAILLWPWFTGTLKMQADPAGVADWVLNGESPGIWLVRLVLASAAMLPVALLRKPARWIKVLKVGGIVVAGLIVLWLTKTDREIWSRGLFGPGVGPAAQASRDEMAGWFFWRLFAAAVVFLPLFLARTRRWYAIPVQGAVAALSAVLIFWPNLTQEQRLGVAMVLGLTVALVAGAYCLPWRALVTWAAGATTAAMFLCVPLFKGSMSWYYVGLRHGTYTWPHLAWCEPSNLGAILEIRYRFGFHETIDVASRLHWAYSLAQWLDSYLAWLPFLKVAPLLEFLNTPWLVEVRTLMIVAYAVTLLLSCIGAGLHFRRHDRRFFYAILAPWVLMFALLPQMVDRYLVWGAAAASAAAAVSAGGLGIYLLLNVMAWLMMAHWMLLFATRTPLARTWLPIIEPTHPDLGWGMLVLAAVTLYLALVPSGKYPWKRRLEKLAPGKDRSVIEPVATTPVAAPAPAPASVPRRPEVQVVG